MRKTGFFLMFLIVFSGCSSNTHFEDKNKPQRGPASLDINQSIANDSPISKGCSKLINEVLYLSEQRKHKEKMKKSRSKN